MIGADQLVVLGIGLALVVAAVAWKLVVRRRNTEVIARALNDPSPETRQAALRLVAGQGVENHVELLWRRTEIETDPVLLRMLADVVARNQWAPTDDPRLIDL